jgi:hypothetical protein
MLFASIILTYKYSRPLLILLHFLPLHLYTCTMYTTAAALLAALAVGSASETRLVVEQVQAYKKLLGTDRLTEEGFRKIFKLHDSDSICENACHRFLENLIANKAEGMEWSRLEELMDEIYGGTISNDPYQPQEVHLSLTGSLSEMKVMWASGDGLEAPFVEYTSSANEWSDATTLTEAATTDTYTVPQNWYKTFAGVIYEANMIELTPGKTSYKYRVGGYDPVNATMRRSKDFTFSSAPVPEADKKTTFATFGDQGTFMLLGFSTTNKLIELQDELGIDAVMYAGDLAYAGLSGDLTPFNGVDEDDEFGHIWDLWAIQNEPVAATRPFMTCPGNHERFYNWTAFEHRYKMPQNGYKNFWFSYDYGNVHQISLSTEHCFDAGCEQMAWLEANLEAAVANRATVPWIVINMHRPMYASELDMNIDNAYRLGVEPLAIKYDVDLVFQGHLHAYERIHPVNDKVVSVYPTAYDTESGPVDMYHSEGKGPVYVVQGNTGAMQFERWEYPKPDFSAVRFANGFIPPRDKFSVEGAHALKGLILESNYTDTFGFGIATFANTTHFHYSNIAVTGTIGVDEFWIVKRE